MLEMNTPEFEEAVGVIEETLDEVIKDMPKDETNVIISALLKKVMLIAVEYEDSVESDYICGTLVSFGGVIEIMVKIIQARKQ